MLEGWVDFISACLYLLAALILKTSSVDRAATKVHLRLVEADEKPADLPNAISAAVPELGHPLVDSSPLAIFAIDAHGMVTYCNAGRRKLLTGWTRRSWWAISFRSIPADPSKARTDVRSKRHLDRRRFARPMVHPRGTVIIAAGSPTLRNAGLTLAASSTSPPIAARR